MTMMGYVFMRFGVDFRPENIDRLRTKVGECLTRGEIKGPTAFLLLNMADELICNIMEHSEANWVELEMHPEDGQVRLIFRDNGAAFDPGVNMRDPRLREAVAKEDGRSVGLYMVSRAAKTWDYRRLGDAVNELELFVELGKGEGR
jgi:hypothetical protein